MESEKKKIENRSRTVFTRSGEGEKMRTVRSKRTNLQLSKMDKSECLMHRVTTINILYPEKLLKVYIFTGFSHTQM